VPQYNSLASGTVQNCSVRGLWIKLGLIDYNGSIEIHNSLLSIILRDQPQIKGEDG
jgi:hypothetical protein